MPRLVHKLPVARLHKPTGQARLRIGGREFYLGPYGSPQAQAEYDRLLGEYFAAGRQAPAPTPRTTPVPAPVPETVTVTVLVAEFWTWAQMHYVKPDGSPTRETDNFRTVLRALRQAYGELPVDEFGPAKLIALRSGLVKKGLARRTVNAQVRRLRQVFRWGVSRELVKPEVLDRLEAVEPLAPGRGGVETSGSRGAVPWDLVVATLPSLPPLLRAFVVVAFHSGARVGELVRLATGQIDRTGDVWKADLGQHKTTHRGRSRRIYFGPKAKDALGPWLLPEAPDAPIFSPLRVDDRQARRKGRRLPGRYYGRSSLDQALRRAIARAGVKSWTLGQLRHSAAVLITDTADLEAARQTLGHSTAAMTRHYAAESEGHAIEVVRRIG